MIYIPILIFIYYVSVVTNQSFAYQPPGVEGMDYVTISAPTTFDMGENIKSYTTQKYWDEDPMHKVTIDYQYSIGKTEVTNRQYAEFLNTVGKTVDDRGNVYLDVNDPQQRVKFNGTLWMVDTGWENYPMVEVSWFGAKAYCTWKGGRLPTEVEWERAARGTDGVTHIYPWGNTHPNDENPAQNPILCSYWWGNRKLQTSPVQLTPTLPIIPRPVGEFTDYASLSGVLDMAGNVWEWTMGTYKSYPNSVVSISGFNDPSREVVRGGSWTNSSYNLRCAVRCPQPRNFTDANLGFRVVWSDFTPSENIIPIPARRNFKEWVENFNSSSSVTTKVWWGDVPKFAFTDGILHMSVNDATECMGKINVGIVKEFKPGDYVDVTVRYRYDRGDRAYARTSVSVTWTGIDGGDTGEIEPGGRGADENTGYPWYLIANNSDKPSDSPDDWREVTCTRIKWLGTKSSWFCLGFGMWANLVNEVSPDLNLWVDWVKIRHSPPDKVLKKSASVD